MEAVAEYEGSGLSPQYCQGVGAKRNSTNILDPFLRNNLKIRLRKNQVARQKPVIPQETETGESQVGTRPGQLSKLVRTIAKKKKKGKN